MRSPIHKGGINTSDKSCLPSTKLPPPKMHYFKAIPIITETKDRHWDRHLTVTMLEGFQLNVICWCRHLIVTYIWFPQAEISFCHGHPLSTHLSCNISVAVRRNAINSSGNSILLVGDWWHTHFNQIAKNLSYRGSKLPNSSDQQSTVTFCQITKSSRTNLKRGQVW